MGPANNNQLKNQVERQARRLRKAERERPTLMAQTIYLGTLGLVFVLPVIGGAYLGRWLGAVSDSITQHIETTFPGNPGRGGSDYASFVAKGAPAFSLSSLSWSYWNYTWHTNLDTYDKIVFDDVSSNAILTAILAYMASEDPERTSREKAVLSVDPRTGKQREWPEPREANREGGTN